MPKRVLITGTSTGFGRDIAERLARRGDHVFATMRDVVGRNAAHREGLERLASQEGLRLRVLELDVTDQWSVDSAIATALEGHSRKGSCQESGHDACQIQVLNVAAGAEKGCRSEPTRSLASTCKALRR